MDEARVKELLEEATAKVMVAIEEEEAMPVPISSQTAPAASAANKQPVVEINIKVYGATVAGAFGDPLQIRQLEGCYPCCTCCP